MKLNKILNFNKFYSFSNQIKSINLKDFCTLFINVPGDVSLSCMSSDEVILIALNFAPLLAKVTI